MPQLHHLALTTADLTTGAAFYDAVFGVLGYKSGYTSDELRTWVGHSPEILLYPVEGDDTAPHTHGRPGLQHAAMEVENRAMVDAVHEAVVAGGGPSSTHPANTTTPRATTRCSSPTPTATAGSSRTSPPRRNRPVPPRA
ncbi:VOC family protein [Streptosporangium lutulentum]